MSGKSLYWAALFVAVLMNVTSNLALKSAMASQAGGPLGWARLLALALQPSLWIGLCCAGLLLVLYLFALREIPVSIAYATVTSLAMIGLMIGESLLLKRPLGAMRGVGICVTIIGVWLVTRSDA